MMNSCLESKLKITVKDGKPQGEMTTRTILASSSHSHKGLSCWLAMKLQPGLNTVEHLMWTNEGAMKSLAEEHLQLGDKLVKIDIKEFFMSGSPESLADDFVKLLQIWFPQAEERKLLMEAFKVLREAQLVRSDFLEGTWKLVEGAGMGLVHSSNLMDGIFYAKVEVQLCSHSHRRRWGIKKYVRYRDDILIWIAGDRIEDGNRWLHAFESLAGYFRLQTEQICINNVGETSQMRYLASTLILNGSQGRIKAIPYIKSTGVPLSNYSAHHPLVHGWPIDYMRKLLNSAGTRSIAKNSIAEFGNWFTKTIAASQSQVERWKKLADTNRRKKDLGEVGDVVWLAVPWHPSYTYFNPTRALTRLFKERRMHLIESFNKNLELRISCKNPGRSNHMMFDEHVLCRRRDR